MDVFFFLKYNEDSDNFFTFSFSLLDIFTIGTIAIFCRNMLCWNIMLRIVPCFDDDWISYGINRSFELLSLISYIIGSLTC